MWLFVFFDLPTNTAKERKYAALFRKSLLNDGFIMKQYSVYMRHCPSKQIANVHVERVKCDIPVRGSVTICMITDKQFGKMINYEAHEQVPALERPVQMEFELF